MPSPRERAEKLAEEAAKLATQLRNIEGGDAIYSRDDVDKIVSKRVDREKKRYRQQRAEHDEALDEISDLRQQLDALD